MIARQSLEEIKRTTQEFFQKTSFDVEITISKPEEQTVPIKIKTEEPKFLIGQNGQTLVEIQHLLKAILRRKIPEQFYIDLDINDYKKKKAEYLREMANSLADEAVLTKKEKILAPMPAYERRIVHLALADRKDITTQSIGEEGKRRVAIKPYP